MFYRVKADILFSIEDEANDFYHDCEVALPKGSVIHPDEPNQECSHIELHRCYHDLVPNQPCIKVDQQDNCPEPPPE